MKKVIDCTAIVGMTVAWACLAIRTLMFAASRNNGNVKGESYYA